MKQALITELQLLLHKYGAQEFYESLGQAGIRASEDTEDISKDVSEEHQACAQVIEELIESMKQGY